MLSLSAAFSLEAGVVAGSRTWTEVTSSSGSAAIRGAVAPCGDGSSVGSGMRSAQRGDGRLGTGSGVALARSPSELMVNGDPCLTNVHSTKAAKSSRGPSSDDGALHAMFKLAS